MAIEHTRGYAPVANANGSWGDLASDSPLFVSGHQPELFHPGVWFKNFLLSSLAKRHSGIGVNVLVDYDLARTFSLSVPSISNDHGLGKKNFSIDDSFANRPWEYTFANELSKWENFPTPVIEDLESVGISNPLLSELWPKVLHQICQNRPVGESLAAARHSIELSAGLRTFELPFSKLAASRSFACFVGELLHKIESVHESYNDARDDYRRHHRIKNRLQPIPKLEKESGWLEAPFWIYSVDDPIRRPLWVERERNGLWVGDRRERSIVLPSDGSSSTWIESWQKLLDEKICIRPRAITTTMFLRLAVGDIFIHGIGGGKYDQLTDLMIESVWPIRPPKYLVATATLRLPIESRNAEVLESIRRPELQVLNRIRDWRFSPEKLLTSSELASVKVLLQKKSAMLSKIHVGQEKGDWHRAMTQLNSEIRLLTGMTEESLASQLHQARLLERERKVLTSREFSFALFPRDSICKDLAELSEGM